MFKTVTKESRFAYNELLLRIKVNNNRDDEQDIYLNGVGELHLKENSCFCYKQAKFTLFSQSAQRPRPPAHGRDPHAAAGT